MSTVHEIEILLHDIKNKIETKYFPLEQRVKDLETRTKVRKYLGGGSAGGDADDFSFSRFIKAAKSGNWDGADFERNVVSQSHQRALGTSDDAAGGYLVPTESIPGFIEMLRAESVCIRMGATVLDNLSGSPVTIPRQTGGPTVYWIGDNEEITASEPTFGQLSLTPKKAVAMVQVSNSLLKQSSQAAEAIIRKDLAEAVGLALDLVALRGSGTNGEPQGIANTPGINTVSMSGAGLGNSLDLFIDMEHELAADNALKGKLGFVFNPAIRKALRKSKVPQWDGDAAGYPLIPAVIMASMRGDGALVEALGYPFRCTTQIPTNLGTGENETEVYFGNWQDLLIAQWAGLEILVSNVAGTAFAYDQTWLRIILNVDIGLRHAESFCLCKDVSIS